MNNLINLGTFKITSGKVIVSDPCYKLDTWCQGIVSNVKKGNWNAFATQVESWGVRNSAIIAFHEDYEISEEDDIHNYNWKDSGYDIGVDSGQAGIFDEVVYRNDEAVKEEPKFTLPEEEAGDRWYRLCCDKTLDDLGAGVIEGGAVASSGYGDGVYGCYTVKDENDEVVGIQIVFIEDDEEDEEYDYYDEDEEDDEEDF